MVDGLFLRPMATAAASGGSRQRRRRLRYAVSIAQHLEVLRTSRDSVALRDVLADMAMRLIDADERDEFEGFDGPTMILGHLSRMVEEQATLDFLWQSSTTFGSTWEAYELHESLVFTVVAICHASIEESIALQNLELGATRLLWEVYVTLPKTLEHELRPLLLSAFRNLAYAPSNTIALPHSLLEESWRLLADSVDAELQVLSAELLTNTASHDPSLASPTPERLASLVHHFFILEERDAYRRVAVIDLLCNLCVDPALCLLVMYELDERKPHRYRRHSGAVYFLDLTECQRDTALRQSMEALAHNLSWSDPAGKRTIQKLGLSSFMARFALEPAINN